MTVFDFSSLEDANPWVDSNFSVRILEGLYGQFRVTDGAIRANATEYYALATLVGKTWGPILRIRVSPKGVGGFPITDDPFALRILIESGIHAGKGYAWRIGNAYQQLTRINDVTIDPYAGGGNSIAAGTDLEIADGDTYDLQLNTATGEITCYQNDDLVTTATDETYASGLTVGVLCGWGNHAGTGISQIVTTGDASMAVTVTDVEDESFRVGETSVFITCTNAGALQGSGRVRICQSDDIADVNGVNQTVTAWADTVVIFDVAAGTLPRNTDLYLFVENDGGQSNAAGYVVRITPPAAVLAFNLLH